MTSPDPLLERILALIAFGVLSLIIVLGLLVYASIRPVRAHSWYPHECCSDRDCAPVPASRVDLVAGGYLIDGLHFVFERAVRVSPDGKFHACIIGSTLICFFAPKPSS